ncbi:DNA alkylation repair protein [Microbacterium gorillae]|uniref:DNA alkylation repair protein n=1 Tax=Microbacterium gorillae TaxID=1231063 RepID=UPI0005914ADE|nr:DNA alkylation repair protein [Microbacterium gorillae]
MGDRDLSERIRAALRAVADPERAPGQQAYMRSAMPYLGVRLPDVRRVTGSAAHGATPDTLLETAVALWDAATHREERYAAMVLLAQPALRGDARLIPLIEHMVRTGAWWDFTDDLAHRMAELLDADPDRTAALLRGWAIDPDHWIRRIAIIAQLGRRERVDHALLTTAIEANAGESDFFLRKAIGWALRDHARVAPDWVRTFVATHDLSPLSRREALRHLGD